ncbi:MAG: cell division ATP-binding protein FtsE [Clostridia bacterium]|nr:cell division ATP-binding protein FtsE [Clostridia bacterium]
MIEFKNVSLTYKTNGVVALDNVTVKIDSGEFVFLVGASGAGKSSFLNVIMGQERIDSGEIYVGPYDLTNIRKRDLPYLRRRLGIVFQDFRLIPKMTVYDNVAFALRVIGMGEKKISRRVKYVLGLVDLMDKAAAFPHQLSTGERQRVAIARALVNNPGVIIADEPTGNLDPVLSGEIMSLFDRINTLGATVIVVTHDLELVHQFDHRIVTIENGRIVSDIPSSETMRASRYEKHSAPVSVGQKSESSKTKSVFNPEKTVSIPVSEGDYTSLDEIARKYMDEIEKQIEIADKRAKALDELPEGGSALFRAATENGTAQNSSSSNSDGHTYLTDDVINETENVLPSVSEGKESTADV